MDTADFYDLGIYPLGDMVHARIGSAAASLMSAHVSHIKAHIMYRDV